MTLTEAEKKELDEGKEQALSYLRIVRGAFMKMDRPDMAVAYTNIIAVIKANHETAVRFVSYALAKDAEK